MATLNDVELKTIDGATRSLKDYRGQVLLLVNTASRCGYTPQYEGLEELHRRFKDRGLRVLGFPCNDFGAQEPAPDKEIAQFCQTRYAVSFDLFAKVRVKGEGQHPLYKELTSAPGFAGEIAWNFEKF